MTPYQKVVPVLPAADIVESLRFYTDHLGFGDAWQWGEPVEYGGLNEPVELHFFPCTDQAVRENTSVRLLANDLDGLYERCRTAGLVHPGGALEAKPWGLREFSVTDPAGVLVTFYTPT